MAKTVYTRELFEEFCSKYEEGRSAVEIAKEMGIPRTTILYWANKDEAHQQRFAQAKLAGGMMLFESAKQTLQTLKDFKKPDDLDAKAYSAWVRALEVSAHGQLKLAAILNPAEYSEKQTVVSRSENVVYCVSYDPNDELTPLDTVTVPKLPRGQRASLPSPSTVKENNK